MNAWMKSKGVLTGICLTLFLGALLGASNIVQNISWDSAANAVKVLFKDGGGTKFVPAMNDGAAFTVSEISKLNLTVGTPVFNSQVWHRNGNTVTAYFAVASYNITTANTATRLCFSTSTALPRPKSVGGIGVCDIDRANTDFSAASITFGSGGTGCISWHSGTSTGSVTISCHLIYNMNW